MPFILSAMRNPPTEQTAGNVEQTPTEKPAPTTTPTPAASAVSSPASSEAVQARPPVLIILGLLFVFMLISPFLGGFQNVIGWLIIGIALWEAWKANRRVALSITGPFTIAAPAGAGGTPAAG
jgi:hypothetical protein